MVIPFDRHFKKRKEQELYRQELVDRILAQYRMEAGLNVDSDMYIEHVKAGFPIEILENIVQKLEQKTGNGGQ